MNPDDDDYAVAHIRARHAILREAGGYRSIGVYVLPTRVRRTDGPLPLCVQSFALLDEVCALLAACEHLEAEVAAVQGARPPRRLSRWRRFLAPRLVGRLRSPLAYLVLIIYTISIKVRGHLT